MCEGNFSTKFSHTSSHHIQCGVLIFFWSSFYFSYKVCLQVSFDLLRNCMSWHFTYSRKKNSFSFHLFSVFLSSPLLCEVCAYGGVQWNLSTNQLMCHVIFEFIIFVFYYFFLSVFLFNDLVCFYMLLVSH